MIGNYYLEMHDINKTFPGAKVLNHIEFGIRLGEVRALLGENGAGKSTLIKILGGIYQRDRGTGTIIVNGKEAEINSVDDAKSYGISIIHQEISLADNMTVYDNLFMGKEITKGACGFIDNQAMICQSQKIMDEIKADIDVRCRIGTLSIAKQQMIEIARALLSNAKIIVMDEPTSSLTSTEIEKLFEQIEKLKQNGIAVVYISHRMDEIFRIADSITVLRDGNLIGTKPASELNEEKVISMMVGRDLNTYMRNDVEIHPGEIVLKVRNLTNKKLKHVSFDVKKGEILGFAGLVGAGRTETAKAVFGIDDYSEGKIELNAKEVHFKNPAEAIKAGIAYVPENRKEEGLILDNSIRFNMTLAVLKDFINGCYVNKGKEIQIVQEYERKLSIKMKSFGQTMNSLSGGNQQKVVLSKWLATRPKILILDEPTRGIDIGAKIEIYRLIGEMAKHGVTIILISSEMEEIINLCSRIVVMYEGEVKGILNEEETKMVTQEGIMRLASGRVK